MTTTLLCALWAGTAAANPIASHEELRERTLAYLDSFSAQVGRAADEIRDATDNLKIEKRALLWKLRVIPYAQSAALFDDARAAYAALLAVAISQRIYLTEGDGRAIFGEQQPRAVKAARDSEEEIRALGLTFLSPEEATRLERQADKLVRRRPIVGTEFLVPSLTQTRGGVEKVGIGWLLNVPLAPFKALSGVSQGAAAIRDFNDTALRFAAIVAGLPEQLRWQIELLAFDLENRSTTRRTVEAVESLSESARVASEAMARLPLELEGVLARSEGSIGAANSTLVQAKELLVPLRAVMNDLREAGVAWERVLNREEAAETSATPERPFDIREWESTLVETSRAAVELRGLAVELRELGAAIQADGSASGVLQTVDQAEAGARSVVDHAAWRAFQVGCALFVMLVAYRLLAWWLQRRGSS